MDNQFLADTAVFLHAVAFGFFCGLFYEFFRFLRLAVPHKPLWIIPEDLLFWLIVTLSYLLFNFTENDGVIRWFSVGGAVVGFIVYLGTIGRILRFFARQILALLSLILTFFCRIFIFPIRNLLKKISFLVFTRARKLVIIIKERFESSRRKRSLSLSLSLARRGFR